MEDNEEILKNLENISDNLEYLIEYFQNKDENKKETYNPNTLELLSKDFSSFNVFLKSIDTNVKISTQKLSAYLDNITPENKGWSDNPEMEQFNFNLNNLVSKLDDLKNNIGDINTNLNINIDTTQIDNIKEKLQSDFNIQLDIINIDEVVSDTMDKLKIFNNIPVNINIGDSLDKLNLVQNELNKIKELSNTEIDLKDLENIKVNIDFGNSIENLNSIITDLNTLHDFKLDTINIDIINTDNIQKLLNDLNQIESLSNINLDSLKNSLIEIQDLDFTNLINDLSNPIKINIDNSVITEIDNISKEFDKIRNIDVEINFNIDLSSKIEELNTELLEVSNNIKHSLIEELNTELLEVSNNIKHSLTLEPSIDIIVNVDDSFLDKIKLELSENEFDIILNPIIKPNDINIEKFEDKNLRIITDESNNANDDRLISYMEENNKLLKDLLKSINNKETKSETINITPENITNKNSIVNVSSNEKESDVSNLSNIEAILNTIASNTAGLLKEQKLSKFKDDSDY